MTLRSSFNSCILALTKRTTVVRPSNNGGEMQWKNRLQERQRKSQSPFRPISSTHWPYSISPTLEFRPFPKANVARTRRHIARAFLLDVVTTTNKQAKETTLTRPIMTGQGAEGHLAKHVGLSGSRTCQQSNQWDWGRAEEAPTTASPPHIATKQRASIQRKFCPPFSFPKKCRLIPIE
jgi:hypothetical protein